MRYLTLVELIKLHERIIEQSGGSVGIRDLGMVESATAQPERILLDTHVFCPIFSSSPARIGDRLTVRLGPVENR